MLSIAGASKGATGATGSKGANQEPEQCTREVEGGAGSQITQKAHCSILSEPLTPPKSPQLEPEINPYAPPETNEHIESVWNNSIVINYLREQIEYSKDTPATKLLAVVVLCEGGAGALLSSIFSMAGESLLAAGDTTLFFSFGFIECRHFGRSRDWVFPGEAYFARQRYASVALSSLRR